VPDLVKFPLDLQRREVGGVLLPVGELGLLRDHAGEEQRGQVPDHELEVLPTLFGVHPLPQAAREIDGQVPESDPGELLPQRGRELDRVQVVWDPALDHLGRRAARAGNPPGSFV